MDISRKSSTDVYEIHWLSGDYSKAIGESDNSYDNLERTFWPRNALSWRLPKLKE
jgi:hypothetical protein